jgi:hypothetical protein
MNVQSKGVVPSLQRILEMDTFISSGIQEQRLLQCESVWCLSFFASDKGCRLPEQLPQVVRLDSKRQNALCCRIYCGETDCACG